MATKAKNVFTSLIVRGNMTAKGNATVYSEDGDQIHVGAKFLASLKATDEATLQALFPFMGRCGTKCWDALVEGEEGIEREELLAYYPSEDAYIKSAIAKETRKVKVLSGITATAKAEDLTQESIDILLANAF